ncbi:CCDC34 family protein [Rhizobium freirei]|nr:CCDC34 family protein [Rhizobium freirei]
MILETILASENLPAVAVDVDTFPSLVKHLRPRLIYMLLTKFNAEDEVEASFEEELDRDLKQLVAKYRNRDGLSSRLVLGLMADGVLHGIVETTDWFEEFDIEVDGLAEARLQAQSEAFAQMQEADARKRDAEERKRLAPYIKKLVADARFLAPKISAAKREALAETLFPDLDRSTVRKIVEKAATDLWLSGSEK